VRVLIVEDEALHGEAIRDGLRWKRSQQTSQVTRHRCGATERQRLRHRRPRPDIPGYDGDEIAERIVAAGSGMPILMLTAADRITTRPAVSSSEPTTTSQSRSTSESSCQARHSTAGAPTNRPPVRESRVCG